MYLTHIMNPLTFREDRSGIEGGQVREGTKMGW